METITTGIVNDVTLAKLLSLSVAYVRKDRLTARILPFFAIGRSIRYDVATVREAMLARMEGGHTGAPGRAHKN